MAVYAPENTRTEFELAPEGAHVAICYMFAEVGLQPNKRGEPKHQVVLWWELPNARMKDGRPYSVRKIYTLSLFEGAILCKDLESWRGRRYTDEEKKTTDITKVLGRPCQLTIEHSTTGDKTYENVMSVTKLLDGINVPPHTNDIVCYDLQTNDRASFAKLPEWVQKKISGRLVKVETTTNRSTADISGMPGDDVPF